MAEKLTPEQLAAIDETYAPHSSSEALAIARLLAHIRAQDARIAALEAAVAVYADETCWLSSEDESMDFWFGQRPGWGQARAALGETAPKSEATDHRPVRPYIIDPLAHP